MADLSYQEKTLYGELVVNLAVFLPYLHLIHQPQPRLNIISGSIALIIFANIVLQGLIAALTRNRLKDERDRLIRLRGYRAGYVTIVSFMVFGMAALWVHTTLGDINPTQMALHFLSVFFAVLMLAEVVKTVVQLIAYRRPI